MRYNEQKVAGPPTDRLVKALLRKMDDGPLLKHRDDLLGVGTDSECPELKACLAEVIKRGL